MAWTVIAAISRKTAVKRLSKDKSINRSFSCMKTTTTKECVGWHQITKSRYSLSRSWSWKHGKNFNRANNCTTHEAAALSEWLRRKRPNNNYLSELGALRADDGALRTPVFQWGQCAPHSGKIWMVYARICTIDLKLQI